MRELSGHAYDWTMMEGSSVEPPTLLLISADDELARELTEALHWCILARWVDEDAAIEWLETNRCDLCLLDRDRIETLLRIRLRCPGMPIIMVGEERPERAGLATVVPGKRELIEAAARQVSELLRPGSERGASEIVALPIPGPEVPPQLLEPTYQNRLRVIGRQIDLYRYTSLHLVEVAGGFVVRALSRASADPKTLVFPDRDFPRLVAQATASRGQRRRMRLGTSLLPTGYEDFLRALGRRLDHIHAAALSIVELEHAIQVEGTMEVADADGSRRVPFRELLGVEDIGVLLGEAFRHRRFDPATEREVS